MNDRTLTLLLLAIEIVSHFLQIFPRLTFLGWIAEKIRGMIRWHHLNAFVIEKFAPQFCYSLLSSQQVLHCGVPERHDHVRLNNRNLSKQERFAHRSFFERWRPISWRAASVYIANQHFLTLKTDRFNYLRQQLTCPANKWSSLAVFVGPGSLAHEHQTSLTITFRMHHVCAL